MAIQPVSRERRLELRSEAESIGATTAIVKRIRRLVHEKDNDVLVWACGDTGSGKSTLLLRLGLAADDRFRPENYARQVHYWPRDYIQASRQLGAGRFLLADEGRNFVFNREGMKSGPRDYFGHLYEGRAFNQIHGLAFPDVDRTDTIIGDDRADIRLTCKDTTGRAVYEVPDDNGHWGKVTEFKFDPLKGPVWDAYEELKDAYMRRDSIGPGSKEPETRPDPVRWRDRHQDFIGQLVDRIQGQEGEEA